MYQSVSTRLVFSSKEQAFSVTQMTNINGPGQGQHTDQGIKQYIGQLVSFSFCLTIDIAMIETTGKQTRLN